MKKIIDLQFYTLLEGLLENIDLSKTKTTYADHNKGLNIRKITPHENLFKVEFENGSSHNYAGMWIDTEVSFILHPKYNQIQCLSIVNP